MNNNYMKRNNMIRVLLTLCLALSLALAFAPAVFAADLDLVHDEAGLLDEQELAELNARAGEISAKYECDVAVVILEKMTDSDGATAWASFIYDKYNYGYGADKSGVLLFLSMEGSDYSLLSRGFGSTVFTADNKDAILDGNVIPLLGRGEYYKAFSAYLDKVEEYLAAAKGGQSGGGSGGADGAAKSGGVSPGRVAATIIIPLIISLFICLVWRSQMKTARKAREADNYIPAGGFVLRRHEDRYLYSTQTYKKIETESSSSSSGRSSSGGGGSSSRSGKF